MTMQDDNNVLITFSQKLDHSLLEADISELTIAGPREDGYDFTWTIVPVDEYTYKIQITFAHAEIPENTQVKIKFNEATIRDENGNALEQENESLQLEPVDEPEETQTAAE